MNIFELEQKKELYGMVSLNGEWDFSYTTGSLSCNHSYDTDKLIWGTKLTVPGYWDDQTKKMKKASFWSNAVFNPKFRHIDFPMGDVPPDGSLPYLIGTGWYRKKVFISSDFKDNRIYLCFGGVVIEANVWINGVFAGSHFGHSTTFSIQIDKIIKYGQDNEILIAVSNTNHDRRGTRIRGFQGQSGGIWGGLWLRYSKLCGINDCFVYYNHKNKKLEWILDIDQETGNDKKIKWSIKDPVTAEIKDSGVLNITRRINSWSSDGTIYEKWSDRNPKLYEIDIKIFKNGICLDAIKQNFGARAFTREGMKLFLNNEPVLLRGLTEHCYFPETCTPPESISYYRDIIKKLKKLGFNWIRFHTWTPSEVYMQAADELGMMLQVEPPAGFAVDEWRDILTACRKHPSVVIYCCGNEELLDDEKISSLKIMADHMREYAPNALFNPQEALRGVEYYYEKSNLGEDYSNEPYPHNPERLERLKEFSDVFGQFTWSMLSYSSLSGDPDIIDHRLTSYQRPCLCHEAGIHGSYINLDLENRYINTRIGPEMFASVRKYLSDEKLIDRAVKYYQNSCGWMKSLRKHNLETLRMCKNIAGYDFLGATDHNYHRCGYQTGIMNEFYELKYNESVSDVLRYNGESVLLCDIDKNRNFTAGKKISQKIYVSLFGKGDMQNGKLIWRLIDNNKDIIAHGGCEVDIIKNGEISYLNTLNIQLPELNTATKYNLDIGLSDFNYWIRNDWDIWIFPEPGLKINNIFIDEQTTKKLPETLSNIDDDIKFDDADIYLVGNLSNKLIDQIKNGKRAVLLGGDPFKTISFDFQIAVAGRVHGNLATVIEDHPIMRNFPHDGYCDWQFFEMINNSKAVLFEDQKVEFNPIIEVVSSYKLIKKQAAIFEIIIGKGVLVVCALNINEKDPAGLWLLRAMLRYAAEVKKEVESDIMDVNIESILRKEASYEILQDTDRAMDPNA